jgi:hypothetical protein
LKLPKKEKTYEDRPAVRAKGTVRPSAIPRTALSRYWLLAECFSAWQCLAGMVSVKSFAGSLVVELDLELAGPASGSSK